MSKMASPETRACPRAAPSPEPPPGGPHAGPPPRSCSRACRRGWGPRRRRTGRCTAPWPWFARRGRAACGRPSPCRARRWRRGRRLQACRARRRSCGRAAPASRRRHRVAEADERAIAAALEESARHADARGGLLVLVGAGLLAGAAARGRARRLVTGVLGLLARWPHAGALSTFSSVVFRTLLRQPESEARLECVLTDPEVRAPRHAPPLPRAAPGRPLQGLTSWPTPWTAQQAACGSLARATSAVERALR